MCPLSLTGRSHWFLFISLTEWAAWVSPWCLAQSFTWNNSSVNNRERRLTDLNSWWRHLSTCVLWTYNHKLQFKFSVVEDVTMMLYYLYLLQKKIKLARLFPFFKNNLFIWGVFLVKYFSFFWSSDLGG